MKIKSEFLVRARNYWAVINELNKKKKINVGAGKVSFNQDWFSCDIGHLVNTGLLGGHFNHLADIDTNKSIGFWLWKSEKTF